MLIALLCEPLCGVAWPSSYQGSWLPPQRVIQKTRAKAAMPFVTWPQKLHIVIFAYPTSHLRQPWFSVCRDCVLGLVAQSGPTLCNPMDCSPPGSSVCGDSPGKNTGVSCQALLQGSFPTQGSNPSLPHCRQILHHLSHQGNPTSQVNKKITCSDRWLFTGVPFFKKSEHM